MRKIITKFLNRRTLPVILLLIILVVTSFFLIPVTDNKLISSAWCGVGGSYYIRSWEFQEDGSFQFTKTPLNGPDVSWSETGTWMYEGKQIEINTIELNNPRSYYLVFQLHSFSWGTGLWTYSHNLERVGDRSSLFMLRPCVDLPSK